MLTVGSAASVENLLLVSKPLDQLSPAVTSNGSNYLMAWRHEFTNQFGQNSSSVFATRIATNGVPLDPSGIGPLLKFGGPADSPAVASNGRDYLVVWRNFAVFSAEHNTHQIDGTIVTSQGQSNDVFGVSQVGSNYEPLSPAAAASGDACLVVWEAHHPYAFPAFVTLEGRLVSISNPGANSSILTIRTGGGAPKVAASVTNFLVVWQEGGDVFGATVRTNGSVSAAIPISVGGWIEATPTVAAGSNSYLVAWSDDRYSSTNGNDIYGARVSFGGTLLDPDGIPLAVGDHYQGAPALARGGNEFALAWLEQDLESGTSRLFTSRISEAGVRLDEEASEIRLLTNLETAPAITSQHGRYLVAWHDGNGSASQDIFGALVDFAKPVLTINSISHDTNSITLTWTASAGKMYRVQVSTNLPSAIWTDLSGDVTASSGTASKADNNISDQPFKFYRVAEVP